MKSNSFNYVDGYLDEIRVSFREEALKSRLARLKRSNPKFTRRQRKVFIQATQAQLLALKLAQ